MDSYSYQTRQSGSGRAVIYAVLGSFLLGGAVVAYLGYTYYQPDAPEAIAVDPAAVASPIAEAEDASPTPTPNATSSEAAVAAQAVERVAEQQGGIDQRLAAAEQRLARLDLQAQAAAGNAARAEGLLIAFAVRRTLEKGEPMGLLEDQLKLRFGGAQPNSVEAVLALAEKPVTLERLVARLDRIAPNLQEAPDRNFTTTLREELSELFVFRKEDSDSPQPQRRIERAKLRLASGQVGNAILEVEKLPGSGSGEAAAWLADARRFNRAQQAFDVLEKTAILEPQRLRDGDGGRIEQPSPINPG